MRVTFLTDLVLRREAVIAANGWYKLVTYYLRSPTADELVAVSNESVRFHSVIEEPLPFDLTPIGVHWRNGFFYICSRSDSGPFWRAVAVTKYKILVAQNWLLNWLARQLYLLGMLTRPCGEEEFVWRRHVRWDGLLIASLLAEKGLVVCGFLWLCSGEYLMVLLSLILSFVGSLTVGARRKYLIDKRDRELRELSLQAFFRLNDIVPDSVDFRRCLMELVTPEEIIITYRARQSLKSPHESIHPCAYHHNSSVLSCAVHPSHRKEGLCNEQCPSFTPKP